VPTSDSPPLSVAPSLPVRLRRYLRPRSRFLDVWARVRKDRFGIRSLHNLVIDLQYGGWCGGRLQNPYATAGAFPTQSIDYAALSALHRRNQITFTRDDVLVDVGCGKGRVINWWLGRRLPNQLVGLELVPEVAANTARRLREHRNVTILVGDATRNLPAEGTFFFLYSPFDRHVMARFQHEVWNSVRRLADLRILYFNCRFLDVFQADPRWRIRTLETGEPEPAALIQPA
jgi:SAM-dependent methyltransferase